MQNHPHKRLMQKRSNVQDNNDITKQSLCYIHSIKVRGHFGNIFLKPSAVIVTFNVIILFKARKEKTPHKFPSICYFITFCCYKMT